MSVFIASVYGELRYIEIDSIKNVPMIEIKNIDDFEAIINEYGVRIGYLQKTIDSSGRNNKKNMEGLMLYIIVDSVYFSFPMKGYLTLTDYKNGNINHFENGTDYNKASSTLHPVFGWKSSSKEGYSNKKKRFHSRTR